MKILVLNPPFIERFSRSSRSPAVSKGGCFYYPIWLAYATGVLEKEGHKVKLIDAIAAKKTLKEVIETAREFEPKLIVADTVTASFYNDLKVIEALKKELPEAFTAMVGTHVSAMPEEAFKKSNAVDVVARGEYDFTLRDLVKAIENKKSLRTVKGLSFREKGKKKGKIIHNKNREFISGKELDEMPFVCGVYKKHLNIKDYFYPSVLYPQVTIVTGRGCPNYCTFCVLPQVMNGHSYRARSIENVFEEIKWIKKNLPEVKDIMIEDDTFTADKERIRKLCRKIIDSKLKINFTCNARADVDLETLKLMKKAGCRLMCVGFESADQKILNNIKKGTVIERIRQFMKDTKKAGILIHGCFILGNKGESIESIKTTIEFAKEIEPDTVQFFPLMVYPGTEAFNWAEKQGHLKTRDWRKWLKEDGTHNTVLSTPWLSSEQLVGECNRARREFYLRPKFIAKKIRQLIFNPKDFPRFLKSGMVFVRYLARGE